MTLIRSFVVEINLEVARREDLDALQTMIATELDTLLELGLDTDLADELHFKLTDSLLVDSLTILVLTRDSHGDLNEARHSLDVSSYVIHHAEEAFKVVDFTTCLHVGLVVTFTPDTNILLNQRDSVELHSREHLLRLLVKEELDADSVLWVRHSDSTLVVSVNDQLTLLVKLGMGDFTNMDDTSCVHVVAQHNVSFTFAEALSFTRLRLN